MCICCTFKNSNTKYTKIKTSSQELVLKSDEEGKTSDIIFSFIFAFEKVSIKKNKDLRFSVWMWKMWSQEQQDNRS